MPIRTSATRLQAFCRPSLLSRTLQRVPPRTRSPLSQLVHAANLRRMSSTSYPAAAPAAAGSSPARESSTSPRPGNAPSAADAGSASGGAAPAPSPTTATTQSHQSPSQTAAEAVETETTTPQSQSHSPTPLPLPALPPINEAASPSTNEPPQKTTTLTINGAPLALDALGPMVIGRDGSVSRVANWHEMVEHEKQATLRVLGKRNQLRLAALRGDGAGAGANSKE